MIESIESFRRKIDGAGQLESVVKTMKSLAASNLGQYERAVISLDEYYKTVELGLAVCLRKQKFKEARINISDKEKVCLVVFGSDQGLVGQFNDQIGDFVLKELKGINGEKIIYTVGERIKVKLKEIGLLSKKSYDVPNSVKAITPLVSQILLDVLLQISEGKGSLYIFNHRPLTSPLFKPIKKSLLPLDLLWEDNIRKIHWPNSKVPEVIGDINKTLPKLIHEYIFVTLFQSCAESLASENASRMAAMQRAEKNIEEILEDLNMTFNRFRQNSIDEELFDVVAGFEALMRNKK